MPPTHHHSKPISLPFLLPFLSLISPSHANTEKSIFTAPPPSSLSLSGLDAAIPVLGPSTSWSVRTNLSRVFPQEQQGHPSWLLLDNLTPGQRYELRVCWSALVSVLIHVVNETTKTHKPSKKEPTAFTLDTYSLTTVFSTPALLQSLTQHAKSAQPRQSQKDSSPNNDGDKSVLLLRVLAAADYFSHHSSLMRDPPPVLVDLILDPYVYNVLPQSLVPTVCYLVVVGVASWFVARWVASSLTAIAGPVESDQTKKQN
ncbi:uncharacterized protein Triagg1_6660 [Trichoderma aggressivum f. europaeum]|uniref:GPI-Mannosyltransferase II co-activator n=1 Tax=Trichoderma aggressivum f. europaeum TaxID=173218 RepID=A0AAE1J708_9HYPO|nr:hypothetical protein Triagg1_6660 [Trichoderma aggressivum f. europaeum]